jgi:hypothetical protein
MGVGDKIPEGDTYLVENVLPPELAEVELVGLLRARLQAVDQALTLFLQNSGFFTPTSASQATSIPFTLSTR